MSLSDQDLQDHCQSILTSRRIRNKIVVLCEGEIPKEGGRRSVHQYRKMEELPDANFYKACVPKEWTQRTPQFFNCGNRKDVINTYFALLDSPNKYYLSSKKLFAIVDLDLQTANIENYLFSDTEAIFHDLYNQFNVRRDRLFQHRLWVTGLIHKEAYFLLPDLEDYLKQLPPPFNYDSLTYNGKKLSWADLYQEMCQDIEDDQDLKLNFQRATERIRHLTCLDCTDIHSLQESLSRQLAQKSHHSILALLTIRKAKEYWKKILPHDEWKHKVERFREQLALQIGAFYASRRARSGDFDFHLPVFMEFLRKSSEE